MKTKLGSIFLSMFFITFYIGILGYSSSPSFNYPSSNNYDERYIRRQVTDAKKSGEAGHGKLIAVAGGQALKDGTDFKWRAVVFAENNDEHLKGQYSLYSEPPHDSVVYTYIHERVVNVNAGGYNSFSKEYEGEIGVVLARQSTRSFNNQNAITEVDTIYGSSHIDGRPLSDNAPIITPTHIARAHLSFNHDDNNDDGGAHNPAPSPTPSGASLSPSGSSYSASAGGTHTANISVPSGYQYVYWYLAGPGIDGLGLLEETDYGYGSSTSASFSWSVPSYASGDHVITAYTYLSDGSIVQPSYTVTVGGSSKDTTPTTNTDDDDSLTASTSPYSLSASSTGSPFSPGDTVTLTLSGYESYYSVDWSLESPQYSTSMPLSYDSGDINGSYDSSVTYTFPSAYPGDYVFKAVVYTYGNMTRYEHTYTVTLGN